MKLVLFLDEIEDGNDIVALAGGKARNLAQLARAGFLVPRGFCLSTDAYHLHLAANHLAGPIQNVLNAADMTDDEKSQRVQQSILAAPIPPDLSDAIGLALRSLVGDDLLSPLAVRSSAVTEDTLAASFAGQHDTFLNTRGELALLENIKRCWASLWTARSLRYRERLRLDDPSAALAVIVQRMVPADRAGVAFTINPVTGADEIVLEAIPGLGDQLVSGVATPDRYRVDKQTWELRQVSPAHPDHSILTPAQIQDLAHLAVQVEQHLGQPQDIEWAQSNGHTYLIQSRPVTALASPDLVTKDGQVDMAALLRRADETGNQIWTDDNVGEVVPGIVTPLTWSVLEPLGNNAFRLFLRRVGVRRYPPTGLFGRFYGRVYFNQSQFQQLLSLFYPSYLGRADRGQPRLARLMRSALAALAWAETGLRALLLLLVLPGESERITRLVPAELERAPNCATRPGPTAWAEAERWRAIGLQTMNVHLAVTILAALLYSLLEKIASRWSKGAVEAAYLVTGLPDMKSAEMGRDMMALVTASAQADLSDCLLNTPTEQLVGCVDSLPCDNQFVQHMNEFLNQHGHTSLREFELAFPRWREDVGYVLSVLQSHLRSHADSYALSSADVQLATRLNATTTLRKQLRIGPRRLLFEFVLRWAQRYSVARENVKDSFVMAHSHLRYLYLALADRLVEQGVLNEADGVFYLTREEIEPLVTRHGAAETIGAIVTRRRAEQRRYQESQDTPKIIEQRPDGSLRPMVLPPDDSNAHPHDQTILRGVAASPGRAIGHARVILDPLDSSQLACGEVLVAPSTNPAWAPLFLNASALVTDIGGLLSHGAIVAREYGLPAVLNVRGATRAIRTGQLLAVDGYAGTVRLLNDQESSG